MLSVQQPIKDDNSETYVRIWSSVCVVRNELTKMCQKHDNQKKNDNYEDRRPTRCKN